MGSLKLEVLDKPSIDKPFSEIFLTESQRPPSWMDPFIDYLTKHIEPLNWTIATRLRRRATVYKVLPTIEVHLPRGGAASPAIAAQWSLWQSHGHEKPGIQDNGAQFNNNTLRDFVGQYGTTIRYASPAHPQTNGQVEAVNKIIKQNLKKRLDDAKSLWVEKLPEVLWAIRTSGRPPQKPMASPLSACPLAPRQ
ncbi:uncharacterized protein LOC112171360 [Rosa chinensis]|uniref:uncharacterized protein LOC112171360 n=1 Tax=Rosa chinensis TaxID=74649 RepID=UPI000D09548B|nr:uncharacterized protein LOC112171360 [Rosa chinensis]